MKSNKKPPHFCDGFLIGSVRGRTLLTGDTPGPKDTMARLTNACAISRRGGVAPYGHGPGGLDGRRP